MAGKKKKPSGKRTGRPLLNTALLLVLVAITMAATFYVIFLKPGTRPQQSHTKTTADVLPKIETPAQTIPPPTPPKNLPRVAIIIDDIGNRSKLAKKIMALDLELSFSFLPRTPFAKPLAARVVKSGRDVLIHLPMEATDSKWDPGPGALLLSMKSTEIVATLQEDLAEFPEAIGINNHMGSKFSRNKPAMHLFFKTIMGKDLFFVDSLTSAKSVGYDLARKLGVKTAKRDIFLDNEQLPEKIKAQLQRLIVRAKTHGSAIGIGHPYPATLAALTDFQNTLRHDVELVGIHELVE